MIPPYLLSSHNLSSVGKRSSLTLAVLGAMSSNSDSIRVSKIAGRYLVFSTEAAALLRRRENTNGTLVGCVPQQPTQNIFLGLPIELRPEEVEALVRKGTAHVVDDVSAHLSTLRCPHSRATYIDSIRDQKTAASRALIDNKKQKTAAAEKKLGRSLASHHNPATPVVATDDHPHDSSLPDTKTEQQHLKTRPSHFGVDSLGVTATSSDDLISQEVDDTFRVDQIAKGPLCRYLQSQGYYMTPGLRFGSKYSVYPGDPLRYHAHYMVNQYHWDEPIPMLHLVEGGRLATAVKKSFVLGGEVTSSDGQVRCFSMEWAGM